MEGIWTYQRALTQTLRYGDEKYCLIAGHTKEFHPIVKQQLDSRWSDVRDFDFSGQSVTLKEATAHIVKELFGIDMAE